MKFLAMVSAWPTSVMDFYCEIKKVKVVGT